MRAEGKLEQAIKDQTGKSFNVRRRAMWDQIEPLKYQSECLGPGGGLPYEKDGDARRLA